MTNEQAQTVFKQFGGRGKLKAMIGAKHFLRSETEHYASFKFSGSKKMNYLKITLEDDLYNLEFGKIRKLSYDVIESIEGVYAKDFQRIFTNTTRLYLTI